MYMSLLGYIYLSRPSLDNCMMMIGQIYESKRERFDDTNRRYLINYNEGPAYFLSRTYLSLKSQVFDILEQ
jgi:hypothetical protein